MDQVSLYAVVSFDDTNEVSVVPSEWLINDEKTCYWPPFKGSAKVSRAIQLKWCPTDEWDQYPARVLSKCEDYSNARKRAQKAEQYSDVQSEGEYGRGYRRPACIKKTNHGIVSHNSGSESDVSSDTTISLDKSLLPAKERDEKELPLRRQNAMNKKQGSPGKSISPRKTSSPGYSASTPSTSFSSRTSGTPRKLSRENPVSQDAKTILQAVANCESTIEYQTKIIKEMKEIVEKISKRNTSEMDELNLQLVNLPIVNKDDFIDINKRLESESTLETIMYKRLAMMGGSNVKTAVKRIIDSCMSNNLQLQYNWQGRLGWKNKANESKSGFKATKFCNIMTKVLLDSKQFTTTEEEIAKSIMVYLRNAGDRCGGRNRRRTETTDNISQLDPLSLSL